MGRFTSGARVTLISQWVRLLVQLVGLVVLARLLTSSDFGLVAMVAAVVAFASLISDMGLSLAALRAEALTKDQKTNLFWVNTFTGLLGAIVVCLSGPLLAAFYNEHRLIELAPAISLTLFLAGLGAQFRVEINRQLRFMTLSIQDVVSSVFGLVVGVLCAVGGLGYWSIVAQSVGQALVLCAMAIAQAAWWPGLPKRRAGIKSLLRFGGSNFGLQVVNLLSRSADVFALGRAQGAAELGIYSRSTQLVGLSIQQLVSPLTRVVLPLLSRQLGSSEFQRTAIRLERMTVLGLGTALGILASCAGPLIRFAMGEQWLPMVPVVQVMAIGAFAQSIGYVYYWAALAQGRAGTLLIAELPGRALMIGGSVVASLWGATAVAAIITLGQILILVCSSIFLAKRAGIESLGLLLPSVSLGVHLLLVSSVTMVSVTWLSNYNLPSAMGASLAVATWVLFFCFGFLAPPLRRSILATVRDARGILG